MNIGELFISLGIKGADSTKSALTGVSSGLNDAKSSGLAAKAAIVGLVYGLERMMSASAKVGVDLQSFANSTGLSTEMLQKWQYASRQFGVGADEMAGTLKHVQNAMTDIMLNKGAPEGFSAFARSVQLDGTRLKDTYYVMEKLQEYAKKGDPAIAKKFVSSLVGDNMFSALRQITADVKNLNPNIYSDKESARLQKVNAGWANLADNVQKAMGHFNAKHGFQMINDIQKVTAEVLKLIEAFIKLSEKYKFFEKLAQSIEVLTDMLRVMNGEKTLASTDSAKATSSFFGELFGEKRDFALKRRAETAMGPGLPTGWHPPMMLPPTTTAAPAAQAPNVTVHINGMENPKEIGEEVKKAVKGAYLNMAARTQFA